MKLHLGLFLFLVFSTFNAVNSQTPFDKFPSFETVCVHVDAQITRPAKQGYFSLGKKEDGYYLLVIPLFNTTSTKVEQIKVWDSRTNRFLKPNLDLYLEDYDFKSPSVFESLRSQENSYNFTYIFGYENATTDLINYLEKKGKLTNQELEQLGRAYSTEATDYIHPNISGANITATKDLPTPDYEKVSRERINSFISLTEKSLACYQAIIANDPNYQGFIIKNIKVKLNHDLMHYAMTMQSVREDELAAAFIKRMSYTDKEIAVAKSMLDDCGPNGVLLTAGDTDSYPLWYVQSALKYKPEITVMNYSLLQTAWYFDFIKQTSNLNFKMTLDDFKKFAATVILTRGAVDRTAYFPAWYENIQLLRRGEEQGVSYFETSKSVRVQRGENDVLIKTASSYIGAVDLLLIDLLHSNPEKDICATSPWVFEQFEMDGQFAARGGVYLFTGNPLSNYWDEKSKTQFLKNLANLPVGYQQNPSDIELMAIHGWTYALTRIGDEGINGNLSNYEIFKRKVSSENVLKYASTDFVLEYSRVLLQYSETDYQKFITSYSEKALNKISSVDEAKITTYEQALMLRDIYKIFSQSESEDATGKPVFTDIQKKVIKALETKLSVLVNSTENIQNTNWSLNLLSGTLLSFD